MELAIDELLKEFPHLDRLIAETLMKAYYQNELIVEHNSNDTKINHTFVGSIEIENLCE